MEAKFTLEEIKIAAANQYVFETGGEMPSMENSTVDAENEKPDVVILRDNYNEILAHYQHLGNLNFFRLDKE